MDSFDNFQYDTASSYGGMGIVDDTSSVYTANTHDNATTLDLENLSLADDRSQLSGDGHNRRQSPASLAEDFDANLDDLKDEGQVDLPPHACWCAQDASPWVLFASPNTRASP